MKIVAILSSPRKNGNTAVLARSAVRGARDKGAIVDEIYLSEKDIRYCEGCMTCMRTGRCPLPDDFEPIREALYASDGIILASPSYGLLPNARMKNFLTDRLGMFTVYTSSLGGKYILGLSTAGAVGAGAVARNLSHTAVRGIFKRGYASGHLGVAVGNGRIEENPGALKRAYGLGVKLVEDIEKACRYPFQDLFGRALFGVVLKRLMTGNLKTNKDGLLSGVYRNLLSRNLLRTLH